MGLYKFNFRVRLLILALFYINKSQKNNVYLILSIKKKKNVWCEPCVILQKSAFSSMNQSLSFKARQYIFSDTGLLILTVLHRTCRV